MHAIEVYAGRQKEDEWKNPVIHDRDLHNMDVWHKIKAAGLVYKYDQLTGWGRARTNENMYGEPGWLSWHGFLGEVDAFEARRQREIQRSVNQALADRQQGRVDHAANVAAYGISTEAGDAWVAGNMDVFSREALAAGFQNIGVDVRVSDEARGLPSQIQPADHLPYHLTQQEYEAMLEEQRHTSRVNLAHQVYSEGLRQGLVGVADHLLRRGVSALPRNNLELALTSEYGDSVLLTPEIVSNEFFQVSRTPGVLAPIAPEETIARRRAFHELMSGMSAVMGVQNPAGTLPAAPVAPRPANLPRPQPVVGPPEPTWTPPAMPAPPAPDPEMPRTLSDLAPPAPPPGGGPPAPPPELDGGEGPPAPPPEGQPPPPVAVTIGPQGPPTPGPPMPQTELPTSLAALTGQPSGGAGAGGTAAPSMEEAVSTVTGAGGRPRPRRPGASPDVPATAGAGALGPSVVAGHDALFADRQTGPLGGPEQAHSGDPLAAFGAGLGAGVAAMYHDVAGVASGVGAALTGGDFGEAVSEYYDQYHPGDIIDAGFQLGLSAAGQENDWDRYGGAGGLLHDPSWTAGASLGTALTLLIPGVGAIKAATLAGKAGALAGKVTAAGAKAGQAGAGILPEAMVPAKSGLSYLSWVITGRGAVTHVPELSTTLRQVYLRTDPTAESPLAVIWRDKGKGFDAMSDADLGKKTLEWDVVKPRPSDSTPTVSVPVQRGKDVIPHKIPEADTASTKVVITDAGRKPPGGGYTKLPSMPTDDVLPRPPGTARDVPVEFVDQAKKQLSDVYQRDQTPARVVDDIVRPPDPAIVQTDLARVDRYRGVPMDPRKGYRYDDVDVIEARIDKTKQGLGQPPAKKDPAAVDANRIKRELRKDTAIPSGRPPLDLPAPPKKPIKPETAAPPRPAELAQVARLLDELPPPPTRPTQPTATAVRVGTGQGVGTAGLGALDVATGLDVDAGTGLDVGDAVDQRIDTPQAVRVDTRPDLLTDQGTTGKTVTTPDLTTVQPPRADKEHGQYLWLGSRTVAGDTTPLFELGQRPKQKRDGGVDFDLGFKMAPKQKPVQEPRFYGHVRIVPGTTPEPTRRPPPPGGIVLPPPDVPESESGDLAKQAKRLKGVGWAGNTFRDEFIGYADRGEVVYDEEQLSIDEALRGRKSTRPQRGPAQDSRRGLLACRYPTPQAS